MGRGGRIFSIIIFGFIFGCTLPYLYLQHQGVGLQTSPFTHDGTKPLPEGDHEQPQVNPPPADSQSPPESPQVDNAIPQTPGYPPPKPPPKTLPPPKVKHHPIDDLMRAADEKFEYTLDKETHGVKDAAIKYRNRRGRHPPPDFDKWVAFAEEKGALVIEEHFDQIYQDFGPLWGISPEGMRNQARSWPHVISVRDHNATQRSNQERSWMLLWLEMFTEIQHLLPDVDFAMNEMDETRLWVPWEKINDYMAAGEAYRRRDLDIISDIVSDFQTLGSADPLPDDHQMTNDGSSWDHAKACCAPKSPGRLASTIDDFSFPPTFPDHLPDGEGFYKGFVSNWTSTIHPCLHPEVRLLHGAFVEPISTSLSTDLFPMFGGSKMPFNNEILLPAPAYWTNDPLFHAEGGGREWEDKSEGLIWRGTASGGRNRDTNWAHFQRHRFVAMTNGSYVDFAEKSNPSQSPLSKDKAIPGKVPTIFKLPDKQVYDIGAAKEGHLGNWIGSFSNTSFMDLFCFPAEEATCSYTDPYFELSGMMSMDEQYAYKYLPDIDGNSFSGRYRAFLSSKSLPIKASIYSEWHDSRLIPWKHFVPMDNTFMDFWGIMDYFLGYNGKDSRDDKARKIAYDGAEWAARVLRKEDMLVYLYRLVLEYARVTDERRDRLGFVDDMLE